MSKNVLKVSYFFEFFVKVLLVKFNHLENLSHRYVIFFLTRSYCKVTTPASDRCAITPASSDSGQKKGTPFPKTVSKPDYLNQFSPVPNPLSPFQKFL